MRAIEPTQWSNIWDGHKQFMTLSIIAHKIQGVLMRNQRKEVSIVQKAEVLCIAYLC